MKKKILLLTFFIVFGISLFGCSARSESEPPVSDTSTAIKMSSATSTNETTESNITTETNQSVPEKSSFSSSQTETSSSTEEKNSSNKEQDTIAIRKYSDEEKDDLSQEFLNWAIPRAEEGNIAVTDNYFDHGASGFGDWFAETEDGEIQIQQQLPTKELPGYDAYDIHALGGVVFYTSLSGTTGYDEEPEEEHGGAGGGRDYGRVADPDALLHKYLLGDNGVVYELIGSVEELRTYQAGFGLYDDDGKTKEIEPEHTFKVSEDADAQKAWKQILESYQ